MAHTQKIIKTTFLAVLLIDNKFSKTVALYRGKSAVYKSIEAILKEYGYCKEMIKKHFNKNFIMSAEEERFQLSNSCWIYDKLFDVRDDNRKI